MRGNEVIDHSQHGFLRGKSCLINFISSYVEVANLVDKVKLVDVVGLTFSKAFDTFSLDKTSSIQLDKCIMHCVSNWLTGGAQRVTVNGGVSGCQSVTSGASQSSVLGPVFLMLL